MGSTRCKLVNIGLGRDRAQALRADEEVVLAALRWDAQADALVDVVTFHGRWHHFWHRPTFGQNHRRRGPRLRRAGAARGPALRATRRGLRGPLPGVPRPISAEATFPHPRFQQSQENQRGIGHGTLSGF